MINGSGGVGKDTFVELVSKYTGVTNYSSVEKVKKIASQCGWQGGKSEKDRKFLSDLKLLTSEYSDMSFNDMKKIIGEFYTSILFLHIREPKDIERAVNEFDAKTLLIKRNDVPSIKSNMADANVLNYNYDYTIHNNSSIENLEKEAVDFLDWLWGSN